MDVVVIIMGVIAVVAGVAGFVMEHSNSDINDETANDTK